MLPQDSAREADTSLKQFSINGLFSTVLVCAVSIALAAPFLRRLSASERQQVLVQLLVATALAAGILIWLFHARGRLEQKAGPLEVRYSRPYATWKNFALTVVSVVAVAGIGLAIVKSPDGSGPVAPFIFSVYALTYQVVVRWWWQFDPPAIEIRRHALVISGLNAVPWRKLSRTSWGGVVPHQLTIPGR